MKTKTYEDEIRKAVVKALLHYGITEVDVEMPCRVDGMVSVYLRKIQLYVPNDVLADMIHGDKWDGDASDEAFRFGGGGYDPVWFECGVEG